MTTLVSPHEYPFKTLVTNLRENKLSLYDYITQTMKLIDHNEPINHALLPEPNRRVRLYNEADKLLAMYPDPMSRPPLFGILLGVKDLFNAEGLPTQAGSKLPPDAFVGREAEIVTQLKKIGAIVLGKTVSTEFAYFSPGETCNPINPKHTPGGSSSGSAAAVAAGYCPIALGTQTIASIIRPASYCGICGYKPSYGLISTAGVFPFSQSADHVGFFAQDMADLSFLAQSLFPNLKPTQMSPNVSLGAVQGSYLAQASGQARANYATAVNSLQDKDYRIVELDPFGDIDALNTMHRRLIAAEFAQNHKQLYSQYSNLYSQSSRELLELGLTVSDEELSALQQAALKLRHRLSVMMQQNHIDIWITPSTTTSAPLGLQSTGSPLMSLPWTNAGLPSLTVPSGFDEQGLPFGLQFVADFNQDIFLPTKVASVLASLSPNN